MNDHTSTNLSWTKNWYGGCLPRNTDTKEHTEYGGCLPPHTEENTMHKNDHGGCLPHVRNNTSRKKRNRQGKRTRNVKRESSRTRGLASERKNSNVSVSRLLASSALRSRFFSPPIGVVGSNFITSFRQRTGPFWRVRTRQHRRPCAWLRQAHLLGFVQTPVKIKYGLDDGAQFPWSGSSLNGRRRRFQGTFE